MLSSAVSECAFVVARIVLATKLRLLPWCQERCRRSDAGELGEEAEDASQQLAADDRTDRCPGWQAGAVAWVEVDGREAMIAIQNGDWVTCRCPCRLSVDTVREHHRRFALSASVFTCGYTPDPSVILTFGLHRTILYKFRCLLTIV